MGRDIAVGQSASFSKTITEWDVYTFAGLSGDLNPAHINEEYAKTTRFGGRIAHGMLSAGLISAVIGMQLPGLGTVHMGQEVTFKKPVYPGDTLTAHCEIADIVYKEKKDFYIVKVKQYVTNQNGEVVTEGVATVMPPK